MLMIHSAERLRACRKSSEKMRGGGPDPRAKAERLLSSAKDRSKEHLLSLPTITNWFIMRWKKTTLLSTWTMQTQRFLMLLLSRPYLVGSCPLLLTIQRRTLSNTETNSFWSKLSSSEEQQEEGEKTEGRVVPRESLPCL